MDELIELAQYIGGAAAGYFTLLTAGSLIQMRSEHVHSQERLEEIVIEEAEALGLKPGRIIATLYEADGSKTNPDEGDDKKIISSRTQVIGFNLETERWFPFEDIDDKVIIPVTLLDIKKDKNGAHRGTVRHELYHAAKHFPLGTGIRRLEWFYKEPAAVLYAISGKVTV